MFGQTIYGLNLAGAGGDFVIDKGIGLGSFPSSLGAGYSDSFRRDRAPTNQQLLANLVGTAYRCANLNANLLATSRLRLYLKTREGEPKAKFVQAMERLGKRNVTAPVSKRVLSAWRYAKRASAQAKSALMDATEDAIGIEEVREHPIIDLLRRPEDSMNDCGLSAYDHRWTTQVLLETLGRAYWYVKDWYTDPASGKKVPRSLLMLRAQLVTERVDTTGKHYITHYEYGSNKLPVQDVIRFAQVDPSNPHLGFLSPMRAADEKIKLERGGLSFMTALLENGGYPAGIYTPKGDSEGGGIGAAEARRLQSSIRSGFAMNNAGRIMVLEQPGTLQTLAWKPAEIIDVERARELAGGIADCFDIPRTKLFRDSANRASGESGDMDHAKDAGLSRCYRFEEVLNGQLVPMFDDSGRLFLAFDSPLPAERTLILDETRVGGQLALTNINEGRDALGLEPIDDPIGECRIVPERNTLVKPDGTLLGDLGALDLATAEATLNPPKDPNKQPPAPPEKKPKKPSGDKKILRRIAKTLELLAQQKVNDAEQRRPGKDAGGNSDRSETRDGKFGGGTDSGPVRADGQAGAKGAGGSDLANGAERTSLLIAEGYTSEEIEALKKSQTPPHVHL